MIQIKAQDGIEKLNILSVNRLAFILKIDVEKLDKVAEKADTYYQPFATTGKRRYFQKSPSKVRMIDNPCGLLKKIQKAINRELLQPICFPGHIIGGIIRRSVRHNAERHAGAPLLVTIDVRKCFPSITNKHVYQLWRRVLGCSPRVAGLLTRLTTFKRYLPQGSPASPLIANLLIWSIDEPIRKACYEKGLIYSTFIDDLGFSGARSREIIQTAASTLADHGLRISHKKTKIMGPRDAKLLTGTRLGREHIRAPKNKVARLRSEIRKLRQGMVLKGDEWAYVNSLVGQLRYIEQLCKPDAFKYGRELAVCCKSLEISTSARKYCERFISRIK